MKRYEHFSRGKALVALALNHPTAEDSADDQQHIEPGKNDTATTDGSCGHFHFKQNQTLLDEDLHASAAEWTDFVSNQNDQNVTPVKVDKNLDILGYTPSEELHDMDEPSRVEKLMSNNRESELSALILKARRFREDCYNENPLLSPTPAMIESESTDSGEEICNDNSQPFSPPPEFRDTMPAPHFPTESHNSIHGPSSECSNSIITAVSRPDLLDKMIDPLEIPSIPSAVTENGAPVSQQSQTTGTTKELTRAEKRKLEQVEKLQKSHVLLPPCSDKCPKKCSTLIAEGRRKVINEQFWLMRHDQRGAYMYNHVDRKPLGDRSEVRNYTATYHMNGNCGERVDVCRTFFLTTLGFKKHNNAMMKRLFKDPSRLVPENDKRGKNSPKNKLDRTVIERHILSFNPSISHYRRKHAPRRLYLPSELSIVKMHKSFTEAHPDFKCSYPTYRSVVAEMKISFAKLGNEECGMCEAFNQHNAIHVAAQKEGTNEELLEPDSGCELCIDWTKHKRLVIEARELYTQQGSSETWRRDNVCFSADLQKVIMLPRMESFKEVMFTRRIIAFNESFVPVGESQKWLQPLAVLWHEACAGRKKEDLVSTFHAFFLSQRDTKYINLWLDNCAAQNKNWTLFSYLVYLINSNFIAAESITINYFEPGHTFMSADSFHHQVELQLKEAGKVYDFEDFKTCVSRSCKGNVRVKEMGVQDFFEWEDGSSKYKLAKMEARPYLHDMVSVKVQRGRQLLLYKNSHREEEFKALDFLSKKSSKNPSLPNQKQAMRGVAVEKKQDIVVKLLPLMPPQKRLFWENLPTNGSSIDLVREDEE